MLWSFGMVGLPYSNSVVPGGWEVLYDIGHAILLIISGKNTDSSMHLMNNEFNVYKISVSLWVCLSIWHLTVSQNTLISLCYNADYFQKQHEQQDYCGLSNTCMVIFWKLTWSSSGMWTMSLIQSSWPLFTWISFNWWS